MAIAVGDSVNPASPMRRGMAHIAAGAMAGTAIGLLISAVVNTRDQATMIVPLALVPQLILAGVLVPKLPNLAEMVAKVGVSGYWLTEAMKSVFIAADGPIRVMIRARARLWR